MKWCCEGFKSFFKARDQDLSQTFDVEGYTGFSIYLSNRYDPPEFVLQFESVGEEGVIRWLNGTPFPGDADFPKRIVYHQEIRMAFCLFCGKKLQRFYRKHMQKLIRSNRPAYCGDDERRVGLTHSQNPDSSDTA